jgi:cardiolipin synthase A/B
VNEQLPVIGGILVIADFAIRIAALIIIPRGRKPTAAMAWLLAIFLIPFVGIILFLLLGSSKLPRARREKQREIDRMITAKANEVDIPSTVVVRRPGYRRWCARTRCWAPSPRSMETPLS